MAAFWSPLPYQVSNVESHLRYLAAFKRAAVTTNKDVTPTIRVSKKRCVS